MFCNSGKSSGPVRPPDGHTSSGLEAAVSGWIPSLPLGLDTLSYICLLPPLTLFPFFFLFSVSSDKPFLFLYILASSFPLNFPCFSRFSSRSSFLSFLLSNLTSSCFCLSRPPFPTFPIKLSHSSLSHPLSLSVCGQSHLI